MEHSFNKVASTSKIEVNPVINGKMIIEKNQSYIVRIKRFVDMNCWEFL
jgi:hypothetical protein